MKLTDRQSKIMFALFNERAADDSNRWVSPGEIIGKLNLSVDPAGISRDWAALESSGLVQSEGSTKSRRYRLQSESDAYLEWDLTRPPELRPVVTYSIDILKDYEPNVTNWLNVDAKNLLDAHTTYDPNTVDAEDYRRVLNALIIDLSFASSVLENVNITWLDTKTLLEFGLKPHGLTDKELRIITNHKDAIEFMRDHRGELQTSKRDILDLHKMVSAGLLGNTEDSGRIRRGIVFFDTSKYRPIDNSFILEEQFDLYCAKAAKIENPHEQALFTMAMIPYLQVFQDGNKRTSRLAMNLPLINAGLPPFSFTSMNKREYMFSLLAFYERGRVDVLAKSYVEAYKVSANKYGEIMRFLGEGGTLSTLEPVPKG